MKISTMSSLNEQMQRELERRERVLRQQTAMLDAHREQLQQTGGFDALQATIDDVQCELAALDAETNSTLAKLRDYQGAERRQALQQWQNECDERERVAQRRIAATKLEIEHVERQFDALRQSARFRSRIAQQVCSRWAI